ncbi:MAG: ECF transporter S component [Acetivibrionales bacterium]|jgi:riboflavin transporter FmnP
MKFGVRKMCTMAILAAISLVLIFLVHFPIFPAVPDLEYDPADIPILIGGFVYGPIAGLIITIVASLIQAVTVSAKSGLVGFMMHVIATGTLVMVSSTYYKFHRNRRGALIGLVLGCLAMTLIMIPVNLFVTTRYWGVPLDVVLALLPTVIVPFNLIKSAANSLVVFIIYKSLRTIIK